MENKVLSFLRQHDMVHPGDRIICAVSGGADSMALLWSLWMLREKLDITVEAAHFNHNLRGEESHRDEQFVRNFCAFHDIPLHVGTGNVVSGKKGLEAAARDARYAFLQSLGGTIATAHTADDNAETLLLHLIRGTGLKGLGGIAPKAPGLIRPMLDITRAEVEAYLADNWISHVEDSSNAGDAFLRNRVRHEIMPLLRRENPAIGPNLSALAQRLREDELTLTALAADVDKRDVSALRKAPKALRSRALVSLLQEAGLPEPNASHIAQAEALVFTEKPSAFARFPGGVILRRNYLRLEYGDVLPSLTPTPLRPGEPVTLPDGTLVRLEPATGGENTPYSFEICPSGDIFLRSRQPGDELTTHSGTKSLKKRFIDRKIPAGLRPAVAVAADEQGILGVCGFGPHLPRTAGEHPVRIRFVPPSIDAEP